jgi:hypothetical protein
MVKAYDCDGNVICLLYSLHWRSLFAIRSDDTCLKEKSLLSRMQYVAEGFASA